jgi:hypothetical protein
MNVTPNPTQNNSAVKKEGWCNYNKQKLRKGGAQ